MKLNLPIFEKLKNSKNILLSGMGGGYDVFCALPIYFTLKAAGFNVHLANYSFTNLEYYSGGRRLSETLVGVQSDEIKTNCGYFPEFYLTEWQKKYEGQENPIIWCFHKTGTAPLSSDYRVLVEYLKIDAIVLVDGGVDSLMHGDEDELGTIIEDAISLYAVNELENVPVRMLACIGMGAEDHVSHTQVLENIARLSKVKGLVGVCALTEEMEVYQKYAKAVQYVHDCPMQDPSVINASIISAVQGEFGNYHLTAKTKGSQLAISPIMALFWFFNLESVVRENKFLSNLAGTRTVMETVEQFMSVEGSLEKRSGTRKSTGYFW